MKNPLVHLSERKLKYYSNRKIKELGAQYNLIIGERSNGKTFCLLSEGIENFFKTGKQFAYIRRWEDEMKGHLGQQVFEGLNNADKIKQLTNGQWSSVQYRNHCWYLANYDNSINKYVFCERPCAYGLSISAQEHYKSTNYDGVSLIIFDEFMSRRAYLPNEWVDFCNLLSTIIRQRNNVTIYMLANTVNKYCPYFTEMGLKNVKTQKQGTIDVYKYGASGLTVAVEYCDNLNKQGKPSDVYFAFDNPHLQMITSGGWEIDNYPHCPFDFDRKDVVLTYFINFDNEYIRCRIISKLHKGEYVTFTFCDKKEFYLEDIEDYFTFSPNNKAGMKNCRNILRPPYKELQRITWYFTSDRVYYSSNEVGEIIRNYLMWCKKGA